MLGADTNVLVRFATRDDAVQSPQSRDLIMREDNQPIYVNLIVLVEFVWILRKVKKLPAETVFAACRSFLDNDTFRVDRADLVRHALDDAEVASCDLADALIALLNVESGCGATATFDEDAQRLQRMVPVEERL